MKFKITVVNILKVIKAKVDNMKDQKENINSDMKTVRINYKNKKEIKAKQNKKPNKNKEWLPRIHQ